MLQNFNTVLISGVNGSGKTILIREMLQAEPKNSLLLDKTQLQHIVKGFRQHFVAIEDNFHAQDIEAIVSSWIFKSKKVIVSTTIPLSEIPTEITDKFDLVITTKFKS
jgi:ABC-type cobalamin/Fe3+-siderophores transport system ATPase subunit